MAKKPNHHNQSHTEVHVQTESVQEVSSPAEGELEELTGDLKRVQAEFVNFKRRAEAERAETMTFATSRIVRNFLTVRDSFDNELAHRPEGIDPAWAASIDTIRAQFDKVMKDLGVEKFESVGQPFDHHKHEAIARDGDGDTVVEQLQAGYQMGDTILRPAMVKVGDKQSSDNKGESNG